MSQTIQVITCWKCGKANPPKINNKGELVYPEKCRNPDCRNLLDRKKIIEGIKKRIQAAKDNLYPHPANLKPHPENLKPHPENILLYNQKRKARKKGMFFCKEHEFFASSQAGLDAHYKRRHS